MVRAEPQADALTERIGAESQGARRMSVASHIETGTVLAGRTSGDRLAAIVDLDSFVAEMGVTLEAVDEAKARLALQARIEHGRGMGHGGELDFGDCFSYALAKALNAPLPCVGEDLAKTDSASALQA